MRYMPMYRIPCVKYRQINHLCIFASGPNLVLNIFLINQGMFGGSVTNQCAHMVFVITNGVSRLQTNKPNSTCRPYCHGHTLREQGDAGGYAAIAISSTSRSMSGYQPLKMAPNSPLSVRTRVCNNKCAPSLDHCICCFLQ